MAWGKLYTCKTEQLEWEDHLLCASSCFWEESRVDTSIQGQSFTAGWFWSGAVLEVQMIQAERESCCFILPQKPPLSLLGAGTCKVTVARRGASSLFHVWEPLELFKTGKWGGVITQPPNLWSFPNMWLTCPVNDKTEFCGFSGIPVCVAASVKTSNRDMFSKAATVWADRRNVMFECSTYSLVPAVGVSLISSGRSKVSGDTVIQ